VGFQAAGLGEGDFVLAPFGVSHWKGSIPGRKEDLVFVAVSFDFVATDLVFVAADLGFVAADLENRSSRSPRLSSPQGP
jgi:hypothetical protein